MECSFPRKKKKKVKARSEVSIPLAYFLSVSLLRQDFDTRLSILDASWWESLRITSRELALIGDWHLVSTFPAVRVFFGEGLASFREASSPGLVNF